jgi:hypothetical protein
MSDEQLERVRKICHSFPEVMEKLSHGEPTFFVKKKVFVMYSDHHHCDEHLAIMIPAPLGVQEMLIESFPKKFYRPPYVGVKGWVGIELCEVGDEELHSHIESAWRMIAPKKLSASV